MSTLSSTTSPAPGVIQDPFSGYKTDPVIVTWGLCHHLKTQIQDVEKLNNKIKELQEELGQKKKELHDLSQRVTSFAKEKETLFNKECERLAAQLDSHIDQLQHANKLPDLKDIQQIFTQEAQKMVEGIIAEKAKQSQLAEQVKQKRFILDQAQLLNEKYEVVIKELQERINAGFKKEVNVIGMTAESIDHKIQLRIQAIRFAEQARKLDEEALDPSTSKPMDTTPDASPESAGAAGSQKEASPESAGAASSPKEVSPESAGAVSSPKAVSEATSNPSPESPTSGKSEKGSRKRSRSPEDSPDPSEKARKKPRLKPPAQDNETGKAEKPPATVKHLKALKEFDFVLGIISKACLKNDSPILHTKKAIEIFSRKGLFSENSLHHHLVQKNCSPKTFAELLYAMARNGESMKQILLKAEQGVTILDLMILLGRTDIIMNLPKILSAVFPKTEPLLFLDKNEVPALNSLQLLAIKPEMNFEGIGAIIDILCQFGFNITQDSDSPPLHLATARNHDHIVRAFLQHVDVDHFNSLGYTALHVAVLMQDPQEDDPEIALRTVRVLLESEGFSFLVKSKFEGRNSLFLAAEVGNGLFLNFALKYLLDNKATDLFQIMYQELDKEGINLKHLIYESNLISFKKRQMIQLFQHYKKLSEQIAKAVKLPLLKFT